jgi:hypothetical protein
MVMIDRDNAVRVFNEVFAGIVRDVEDFVRDLMPASFACARIGEDERGGRDTGRLSAITADSQGTHQLRGTSFAGEPHHREKPKIMSHNDFNDPLPGSRHE